MCAACSDEMKLAAATEISDRESLVRPDDGCVAVAMSGGVDSSVAAALLCREGYRVIGVTLQLHHTVDLPEGESCGGLDAISRARAICEQLGILHEVVNLEAEFERWVLQPAWQEYARGRTPSPCLICNERIKFGALLDWCRNRGAQTLATGHYAQIQRLPDGTPVLLRGADRNKDQSYFLAGLTREQLGSILFPLGGFEKDTIRKMAREMGLSTAGQRESQDACFAQQDQTFAETLRERFRAESRRGLIIDENGNELGHHEGIHRFTVGQRRGIGVSSTGRRWVKTLRSEDAAVVLTGSEDALKGDRMTVSGINWIGDKPCPDTLECAVQIRYRHEAEAATIHRQPDGTIDVIFAKPVRAITPGQAAVFYEGNRVLGRGWIDGAL